MRRLVTRWVHRANGVRRGDWSVWAAILALCSGVAAAGCVSREAYFEVEARNETVKELLKERDKRKRYAELEKR